MLVSSSLWFSNFNLPNTPCGGLLFVIFSLLAPATLASDEAQDRDFFETRIRPVLVQHCYECHSTGSPDLQASLQLDHRAGLLRGGDSGPAIVPGQPEESLLLQALRYESLEMPPSGKLSEQTLEDFEQWIETGAFDPRDQPPSETDAAQEAWRARLAERSQWWSLQSPQFHEPPIVDDAAWMKEPVDRFIRARLDAAHLTPALPASPEVLVRRLSFILTGLPPRPEQISHFEQRWQADPDAATAELVDQLLQSPHYGERFARHWMDVIRYTDTYGYEWDIQAKGSWEYRDYLIRAFNQDVGFDQLLREQIAGDLLPDPRINPTDGINESLIGPMFFHLGERRHGSSLDFSGIHQEMVDSQIDAFSKAFLGMTVACARCHDHKLDAISQRDYYALASVFMTPRWTSRSIDTSGKYATQIQQLQQLRDQIRRELGVIWKAHLDSGSLDLVELARRVSQETAVDAIGHPLMPLLGQMTWAAPRDLQARAQQEATELKVEEDGITLRAEGSTIPETDSYVVSFATDAGQYSHLQLRALTHPSLGNSGPGRTAHGNFVLSHISVAFQAHGQDQPQDVAIRGATADYEQPGYPVSGALDPDATGWGIGLGGNVDRAATLVFDQPLSAAEGGVWTVTLQFQFGSQHTLGRFRLALGSLPATSAAVDTFVQGEWQQLQRRWQDERSRRQEHNRQFSVLFDGTQSSLPADWAMEGSGLQSGWCDEAAPLIALTGDSLISGLLPRGYHTHALSSKLPGAIRLPEPERWPAPHVGLQLAGGDWAGYRSIPQNAFLTEGPVFFDPNAASAWTWFSPLPLKNGVTRILTEISTPDLNANFPPRTGVARMGNVALPNEDSGEAKRGWFSLTGIVVGQQPGQPGDELGIFASLYRQPIPSDLATLQSHIRSWFRDAVDRWVRGVSEPGDAKLLHWLLTHKVLPNRASSFPEIAVWVEQYRQIEAGIDFPRSANSMDERHVQAIDYRINLRGDVHAEGDPIPGDFLEVFAHQQHVRDSHGSGRLELAEYLASPRNPQTARVFVNRVWQWVFGMGLVDTPSDFGKLGGRPSHPELLDWLALSFMQEGWSTKTLVRRLVLSQTFRQSGQVSRGGNEIDPDNRLLHHFPTRRLEAEAIRDSLLAVSGRLDRRLYGRPIRPHRPVEDSQKRLFSGPLDGHGRRSIYLEMSIMQPPEFLVGFNLPDLKIPTGRRDQTNVPAQSLILLNHTLVTDLARYWADQLLQDRQVAPETRIDRMFLTALGRLPTEHERTRWSLAVQAFRDPSLELMSDRDAWSKLAHALFNTKEFLYYR